MDSGALEINGEITPAQLTVKWQELLKVVSDIEEKIPRKEWKFKDLIISSDTEPTALHLRSDERHNSYITNRNNFVENNTTENNDLIISSANRLVLQTGYRDQNHGHDQLVVLTNRIDMIGTKISGNAGVLAVEGRDHVYLEFFPLGYVVEQKQSDRNRKGWLGYPDKGINDLCVMNENNANLKLGTNKTDILTINKVGHVGIGTTEPEHRLHVHGNVRFENPGLGDSSLQFENHGGFHRIVFDQLRFFDNQAGGDNLIINDGKIGIATLSPQANLHVAGHTIINSLTISQGVKVYGNVDVNSALTCNILKSSHEWSGGGGAIKSRDNDNFFTFKWTGGEIEIWVGNQLVKSIRAWGVI
jgi:hypothetical protein